MTLVARGKRFEELQRSGAIESVNNVRAFFVAGKLKSAVRSPGMVTTTNSDAWAKIIRAAGMPTKVERDTESLLRGRLASGTGPR